MKKDQFWKYFLISCAVLLTGASVAAYATITVISPTRLPAVALLPENMENTVAHAEAETVTPTDYFFRESIPLGYDKWSWSANVNWRASTHYFEGSHSLEIRFTEPWGGVEISGPGTPTAGYNGIALAVFAEEGFENFYLELYDGSGTLVGRQAIGWYFPEKKLVSRRWQEVIIPFVNFNGTIPRTISKISLIGKQVGSVYVDNVHLVAHATPHERWEPQSEETNVPVPTVTDILHQTPSSPLPYFLGFDPAFANLWYTTIGSFRLAPTEAQLSLLSDGSSAQAIFLGGKDWTNYRADTVVNWGSPDTFTFVMRYANEQNYASCAFSTYGLYVQIYEMRNGESRLVSQSPELGISRIEAWKNVRHGAEVSGNRISCYLNGEMVLAAELPTIPSEGTVGLEAWSPNTGGSPHRLQSFSVSPL